MKKETKRKPARSYHSAPNVTRKSPAYRVISPNRAGMKPNGYAPRFSAKAGIRRARPRGRSLRVWDGLRLSSSLFIN